MTTIKRPRGRPIGSGDKKDEVPLGHVADLIIRAEATGARLTASSAMKQVIRTRNVVAASPEAALRRLQRKWRYQKEALLAAARHREAARTAPSRTIDVSVRRATESLIESLNRPLTASQQISRLVSGHTSTMQSLMNALKPKNPMSELMQQLFESQRRMKDLVDPPGLRSIREITSNLDNLTKRFRTPV